jgi:kynurenine formamidase
MSGPLIELLKAAKVYDLEQPRFAGMPIYPGHRPGYFYALYRRHRDGYKPSEHGPRSGAAGMLTMMEHSGTHIDALCHQACDLKLFGGIPADTVESSTGFARLGVEEVPPLLGRGILLDVAGWKGQERLPEGDRITAEDLAGCAAAASVQVERGDVVLVRTGYGTLWNAEADYLQAAGVSKSASIWLAERGVRAVGVDNMTWDVVGQRDPETQATLFGHVYLLPQKGIYIMENLNLEDLARDRCFSFAFVGIPLKLKGATGSPIRPLALV